MKIESKILLVDDTRELNDAAARILRAAGYNVVQAFGGEECLKLLSTTKPDLILLDVVMPGMDGVEVCKRIKSDPDNFGIYIILLSGLRIDSDQQAEGLEAGADGYIIRPIRNRELIARIEAVIRIVKSEKSLRKALTKSQRLEKDRRNAENKVRKMNRNLEELINERTGELNTAKQELENFSYSVAHNLRAPLRSIGGFSEIVMSEYEDKLDKEAKRLLEIIRSSGYQMLNMIDGLLLFMQLGRVELKYSDFDLNLMINKVFLRLTNEKERKRIAFSVDNMPVIFASAELIEKVWENLISNSIKFSSGKEKSEVHVGFRIVKREYVFFIKDNGVGFDEKYIHKLFGVFERLHSVKDFEGLGTGLPIAKRIIKRHGGRFWAEGEVGKGATFFFTLPKE